MSSLLFKYLKRHVFIILLTLSILTRLYYLAYGMSSITHDEADIYFSGRILAVTGKDGYRNTIFATTGFLTAKPSIPIYISALGNLILPSADPFFSRLPFVLINSLLPCLIFLIAYKLTHSRLFSVISFLVINFSPWFGLLSATGYEAFIGLTFFLIGFYILLTNNNKRFSITASIFFLFLSFNSYMGMKIIFPLLIPMLFFYTSFNNKEKLNARKIIFTFLCSFIICFIFFFISYILPNHSLIFNESKNNIVFFNKDKINHELWYANITSSGPIILKKLVSNKITVPLRTLLVNYSESFNLQSLFITGDNSSYGYSGLAGMFYITDFLFFIIGLLFIIKTPFKRITPLLFLFIIGGLPIAVAANNPSITFRGVLLIIPYAILITYGIYLIINKYRFFTPIYLLLLVINITIFQTVLQVRIKTMISGQFHTTEKVLVQYLNSNKDLKLSVYVNEPFPTMILYMYYNNNSKIEEFNNLINRQFNVGNIKFMSGCPKNSPINEEYYIVREITCRSYLEQNNVIKDTIITPADNTGDNYALISTLK